jgi:Flp pilus assembly protein TadG
MSSNASRSRDRMIGWRRFWGNGLSVNALCFDDSAAQIVEFALSVPLLVLFVIGIFDFSSAITLKQKLANAAREGARVAAADPASDLSASLPVSVADAFDVIDAYFLSEKIPDCGITRPTLSGTLTWSSNGQTKCPMFGFTLTINRGYYFPITGSSSAPANCATTALTTGQTAVVATCVSIQYAYSWQFTSISGFFGNKVLGPSVINTSAIAFNEN